MEKGIKETVKNLCKSYAYGEDGMGTVEIILIIVEIFIYKYMYLKYSKGKYKEVKNV